MENNNSILSINYKNFLHLLDASNLNVTVFRQNKPQQPAYINTSLLQVLGYSEHELNGQAYTGWFPPEYLSAMATRLSDEGRETAAFSEELNLSDKDGKAICFKVSSAYATVDQEQLLISLYTNVSVNTPVHTPITSNERSLKDAQTVAKMGHWEWKLNRKPYYSEQLLKIFDFPSGEEFTFEAYQQRIHPEDKPIVAEAVSNALYKYLPYDIHYRYVLPSGQIKYLHSMADAFVNEAGETEKMLGTVQDITQHVITQQALERSEKVLKVAQRIAKVGNWEWDIIEDKRYYSDEMLNIYGLKPSNVNSYKTFVEFYHPEDRDTIIKVVTEALRNFTTFDITHRILLPGGEVKHIHSTGELFTNEQGVAEKMIGTIQDITQQVLARQALEKSEKRLKRAQQIGKTGYWEWDIVTDEVYWSDELYLLYGMDKESFVPSIGSVVEMMYETERQRITDYIYGCLAQKQTHYQIEGPVLTNKGNKVYFLAKAEIIYDAAGNAVRMEGVSHDITELKKAEEDLRFKQYLLQNVNDAIISTDRQMCITSWNKAAGKIYGYTEKEALGKNLTDLLGFTPPVLDNQEHADFLEKGYFKGEFTMKRKDSSQVTIEAHTIALIDDKGEFTGHVSVDRDITAYKQMQDKVYESEAMLKLVINTVPQAIFWKDINAVYRGCNQNFIHMFGLKEAEQLIGKNDRQMYWGEELGTELLHQDQQIMQGKIPRLFYTKTIEAADKSLIWLEVKLVPLYNKEEQIIGVLGTAEDITEKKSIEQALIQSKANLEAIIENTDDLIWALDKEYKMIAMNSNLARFWKQFFDSTLQVGDSCFDIQPLWAQERWVQVHQKVLSGEKVFVTKRYRLKDTQHWFDIACFPIVEAGGKITGASYVVRDVTQRKKQEKLLLQYVKRHSQLSLEQEKQKMMAVIKGQEEERRTISMELHDGVGQMLTALNFRMNKITDKLLPQIPPDISLSLQEVVKLQKSIYQEVRRISENLMPQFLNDFPLEQALEQLINQSFGNTGIQVDSDIMLQGNTFEKGVEIALFRMAQEIFNNILKHSQATVVSITMHVKKAGLFFYIEDNGIGFDMAATHHKMGKGLNNIRQRVSLLNGSFVVASHPGEGFQLQIKIPVSSYEKN